MDIKKKLKEILESKGNYHYIDYCLTSKGDYLVYYRGFGSSPCNVKTRVVYKELLNNF